MHSGSSAVKLLEIGGIVGADKNSMINTSTYIHFLDMWEKVVGKTASFSRFQCGFVSEFYVNGLARKEFLQKANGNIEKGAWVRGGISGQGCFFSIPV